MAVLDTTVFVDIRGRGGKTRKAEAEAVVLELVAKGEIIATTRINVAELYVGAELSNDKAAEKLAIAVALERTKILDFDDDAAQCFGRVRAFLQKQGRLVGDLDMLIGSIALANGESIVTRNSAHFSNMPGLKVISYGK